MCLSLKNPQICAMMTTKVLWRLLALVSLLGVLFSCKEAKKRSGNITPEVIDTMTGISAPAPIYFDSTHVDTFLVSHPRLQRFSAAYRDFYRKRSFQYVWINEAGISEIAYGLTSHLMNVVSKDSSELPYNQQLDSLMQSADFSKSLIPSPETELLLTGMYFYYAEKLLQGVDESISKKLGWFIPRRKLSVPALLDSFLVAKKWDDFEKNALNDQYFKLRESLSNYRNLEKQGGEVVIPNIQGKPTVLKPGDSSATIRSFRQRLAQLGFSKPLADTAVYLMDMAAAVAKAQRVYGLKEDSVIGNNLINELNVPARKRGEQLLVNMERLRWIPARIEASELILVNIPDFKLVYFVNGKPDWNCRVVVGSPVNKTVVFSGMMDYVVFSPYWYVPQSIINNEIGLSRAKSPAYLKRKNMEWSGGSLREKPGPNNSLGLVKFIFPNSNSIYLHDTPSKDLFNRDTRAFSHGCIRVSEPFELAKKVLSYDSSWTDERIKAAMKAGKEQKVVLQRKVPVYIGYFTAFADKDGLVHFRKDVYNRDGKMLEMLAGGE
jgi:murein L,D-transpeptidase YcbB/YkuD